jgi:hypothetical protein
VSNDDDQGCSKRAEARLTCGKRFEKGIHAGAASA